MEPVFIQRLDNNSSLEDAFPEILYNGTSYSGGISPLTKHKILGMQNSYLEHDKIHHNQQRLAHTVQLFNESSKSNNPFLGSDSSSSSTSLTSGSSQDITDTVSITATTSSSSPSPTPFGVWPNDSITSEMPVSTQRFSNFTIESQKQNTDNKRPVLLHDKSFHAYDHINITTDDSNNGNYYNKIKNINRTNTTNDNKTKEDKMNNNNNSFLENSIRNNNNSINSSNDADDDDDEDDDNADNSRNNNTNTDINSQNKRINNQQHARPSNSKQTNFLQVPSPVFRAHRSVANQPRNVSHYHLPDICGRKLPTTPISIADDEHLPFLNQQQQQQQQENQQIPKHHTSPMKNFSAHQQITIELTGNEPGPQTNAQVFYHHPHHRESDIYNESNQDCLSIRTDYSIPQQPLYFQRPPPLPFAQTPASFASPPSAEIVPHLSQQSQHAISSNSIVNLHQHPVTSQSQHHQRCLQTNHQVGLSTLSHSQTVLTNTTATTTDHSVISNHDSHDYSYPVHHGHKGQGQLETNDNNHSNGNTRRRRKKIPRRISEDYLLEEKTHWNGSPRFCILMVLAFVIIFVCVASLAVSCYVLVCMGMLETQQNVPNNKDFKIPCPALSIMRHGQTGNVTTITTTAKPTDPTRDQPIPMCPVPMGLSSGNTGGHPMLAKHIYLDVSKHVSDDAYGKLQLMRRTVDVPNPNLLHSSTNDVIDDDAHSLVVPKTGIYFVYFGVHLVYEYTTSCRYLETQKTACIYLVKTDHTGADHALVRSEHTCIETLQSERTTQFAGGIFRLAENTRLHIEISDTSLVKKGRNTFMGFFLVDRAFG